MTWGNVYASASMVSAYTVLQPVTSSVLTAGIVLSGAYPNCAERDDDDACLSLPGVGDLGAVGVILGLYFVITSEAAPNKPLPDAPAVSPLLDGADGDDDVAGHDAAAAASLNA